MPQTDGALADGRVLDLTQRIAGPFWTTLLADFGASVRKVERPGRGDVARHMAPFLDDTPGLERSGLFASVHTNTRSITLNLKDPTGLRLLQHLVQDVDVIVESFAPRVMPSLGFDFASLQAMKSDSIVVSIANVGQTGPSRDWQAEEMTLAAMGGLLAVTGAPDREPLQQGGHQRQSQAGLNAAVATRTALWARDMLGVGQPVDVALMECAVSIQERRGGEGEHGTASPGRETDCLNGRPLGGTVCHQVARG